MWLIKLAQADSDRVIISVKFKTWTTGTLSTSKSFWVIICVYSYI